MGFRTPTILSCSRNFNNLQLLQKMERFVPKEVVLKKTSCITRPMIFEHTSYRSYLKTTLADRFSRHASYSLRAFSRDLGINSSALSEVLTGKRNISLHKAFEISQKLKLNSKETDYFNLLVQFDQAKTQDLRKDLFEKLKGNRPASHGEIFHLDVDQFKAISEWYHYALLQSLELDQFKANTENLVQKLGLKKWEVEAGLERLERLDLIKKNSNGIWVRTKPRLSMTSPDKNLALQHFHKQMLQKSLESIESQSPQEKFIGSDTMAFDPSLQKEFEEITEDYFKKVAVLSKKSKKRTQVYHLNISFFSLTNGGTK